MTMALRTVLVTGASGFLGHHVTRALMDAGFAVRAALRGPADLAPGVEPVLVGSIGATTEWRAALTDIDAIVHLAARAHRSRSVQAAEQSSYDEVNAKGTVRLAQAAAEAGVRHFVFMSSIAVNGSSTQGRSPYTEADTPMPRSVYGESKAAAEEALRSIIAGAPQMAGTIIRPPMVYGRFAPGNFALLLKAVEKGWPLPFGGIRNRRAFVAVENVASFVVHSLKTPERGCNIFIVADDEQVSTPEFIRRVGRAGAKKARLFPVPSPALAAAATLLGRRDAVESLINPLEVNTAKARASGWRPVVSLDQGLALACRPSSDA